MHRYQEGRVILEVEGRNPSPDSRYTSAFVLVMPATEIINLDGQVISMYELAQGQNVAILLRGHGDGDFVGMGVARKMWLVESY